MLAYLACFYDSQAIMGQISDDTKRAGVDQRYLPTLPKSV